MSPRFDTLAIARDLRNHGFSQDQAEALAGAVNQAVGLPDLTLLATKEDLTLVRTDVATLRTEMATLATTTKSDIATLATKSDLAQLATKSDLAAAKMDTLKWTIGIIVSSILINVLALIKLH